MTSGVFQSIPIHSISVSRTERQRKELSKIDELAASFKRVGQIHPILIRRETHELIAGERRLEAARLAGWTHINAQFEDQTDPVELKALEYEENIRRENLPWQEEIAAVKEYHSFKLSNDPAWTMEKTAEALGVSRQKIGEKLEVAKAVEAAPKLAGVEKFSTARGIVRRAAERKYLVEDSILAELLDAGVQIDRPPSVLNVSFHEWAATYDGPKFNLIHCDFPYGINADKINQGESRIEFGDYADTPDVYFELLATFCNHLNNFCAEQAHLMFWFSMKFYTKTMEILRAGTDFIIDDFPLIWVKSDGKGLLPDPSRGPRRLYETALYGYRGDRKIVRATDNVVSLPTGAREHMSQKPDPVLRHFFKMLVDDSTALLDPTCGSAGALIAAEALGARAVLGLEVNSEFAERASVSVEQARTLREATDE